VRVRLTFEVTEADRRAIANYSGRGKLKLATRDEVEAWIRAMVSADLASLADEKETGDGR
jgi:hypothetical protein